MRNLYFAIFLFASLRSLGQLPNVSDNIKITYERSSNGSVVENQDPVIVFANASGSLIVSDDILKRNASVPYETTSVNVEKSSITSYASLKDGKTVSTIDSTALDNQKWELTSETRKILGYTCRKARTVVSSNWIEIWYTNELKVFGGPTVLGQKLGLVLETVRNGNYQISAIKIDKNVEIPGTIIPSGQSVVDAITYKHELWKSRFINVPVFKNQQVNFSDDTIAGANTVRLQHGQVVLKKVSLPSIPAGSLAFLDVVGKSKGDAYDRTGLVFIVPTEDASALISDLKKGKRTTRPHQQITSEKSGIRQPHLELMRFFTPFGIGQYNSLVKLRNKTWLDSTLYRQDISDVLPAFGGRDIVIGIHIGNYDKGGHEVSANITIHKEGIGNDVTQVVLPLFYTEHFVAKTNVDHNALLRSEKGFETKFTLTAPLRNARLRYIATGHGGWENGDEFLRKKNTIVLNGKPISSFVPWRTDCGSYRLSNPASGNFENGLSSSDYSRSNWCPGTTTNPVWIDLGNLEAGNHCISVKIPVGEPEGESTSSWTLSGVLIGDK